MAQIRKEIREGVDEFETGDGGFDIVEALNIILPDDAVVKDPVCDHLEYQEMDQAIPQGFGNTDDTGLTGFTVVIPWKEHKVAFGYIQQIRNVLDEHARYPVEDSGVGTGSEIGASLSFTVESSECDGEMTFKIAFFVDDSTR